MSTNSGAMRWVLAPLGLSGVIAALAVVWDAGVVSPPWVGPSISGYVFEDLNGNTVRDSGEPGVKGWLVLLCELDMCRSATTGADGGYHFEGVDAGKNGVGLDVPFGWRVADGGGDDIAVRFLGEELSGFSGAVWRDGASVPEGTRVEALVAGKVCGEGRTGGTRESDYGMWVVSAKEKDGCGTEGAEVSFRVDGAMANQTAEWHLQQPTHLLEGREVDTLAETLDLVVGPEPAIFEGPVYDYRPGSACHCAEEGTPVRAYVKDRLCGESAVFSAHPLGGMYQVAVLPHALRAGCGTEGASVRFTVGDEPANEEAFWQPGTNRLTLTVGEPPPPTPTPTPWPTPSPTAQPDRITPTPAATPTPRPTPTASAGPAPTALVLPRP